MYKLYSFDHADWRAIRREHRSKQPPASTNVHSVRTEVAFEGRLDANKQIASLDSQPAGLTMGHIRIFFFKDEQQSCAAVPAGLSSMTLGRS